MRCRGSITVFLSLTVAMVLSLFFTMAEAVHATAVAKVATVRTRAGAESMMAEYNRLLWSEYGILAVDMGYGEPGIDTDKALTRMYKYMSPDDHSYIDASLSESGLDEYRLISDGCGRVLIRDAVIQETLELPQLIISGFSDFAASAQNSMSSLDADELMDAGMDADAQADEIWRQSQEAERAAAEAAAAQRASETGEEVKVDFTPKPRPGSDVENPIKTVKELKKGSLLSQVIPPEKELSAGGIFEASRPSERVLEQGTAREDISLGMTDRIIYAAYLKEHFGCYTNDRKHSGASYEWEYVLCGNDSDIDNLKGTIELLLACRIGENMTSILTDKDKQDKAMELATLIVGFTMNEGIIKAVQFGILAAWTYIESLMDVRALLDGEKLSIVKSSSEWTSSLTTLPACIEVHSKAKGAEHGFSYGEYLLFLSYIHSLDELGLRSLDVLENALRSHEEYAFTFVDQMAAEATLTAEFTAAPIFFGVIPHPNGGFDEYRLKREEKVTYLTPVFGD